MLTELRFKNWRSLRNVTISDLTPITVFVGANSSGKTNILDGLHFLKRSNVSPEVAVFLWQGLEKIKTLDVSIQGDVELGFTFDWNGSSALSDQIILNTNKYQQFFGEHGKMFPGPVPNQMDWVNESDDKLINRMEEVAKYARHYKRDRWQLLREDMTPPLTLDSNNDFDDPFLMDARARNLPMMLDFMKQQQPTVYAELQADLRWLLSHVEKLDTRRDERETRIVLHEKMLGGTEAPSISGGTARVLAMLTAYYALDMRSPELPGLVVIEEPDTAIHPLLLENFVELLRGYTTDPEHPRQFIMTTHNPQLLNYLKPKEVRIVERDQQGITTVHRTSDEIAQIWLDKYGLGEAWMTRSLGGVPR